MTKLCSKCRAEKPAEDFRVFMGNIRGKCRDCEAGIQRERRKGESVSKREQRLAELRVWKQNNPEKVELNRLKHLSASRKRSRERSRRLRGTKNEPGPQREHLIAMARAWKQKNHKKSATDNLNWCRKNRERRRASALRFTTKHHFDSEYRLLCNMRSRVSSAVRGKDKSAKTIELVGCSIKQLHGHLEAKFEPGMSWANYGFWHVDHIRPCVSFDFSDRAQQRECFHYTNLQPLWAADNIRKKDKWP